MIESELVEGAEYEGEQVRTGELVRGELNLGAWNHKDANGRATASLVVTGELWHGHYVWLDTLRPVKNRRYPLPKAVEDTRFTFGLFVEVGAVLERHGYPKIESGLDVVELEQALFRFIYGTRE